MMTEVRHHRDAGACVCAPSPRAGARAGPRPRTRARESQESSTAPVGIVERASACQGRAKLVWMWEEGGDAVPALLKKEKNGQRGANVGPGGGQLKGARVPVRGRPGAPGRDGCLRHGGRGVDCANGNAASAASTPRYRYRLRAGRAPVLSPPPPPRFRAETLGSWEGMPARIGRRVMHRPHRPGLMTKRAGSTSRAPYRYAMTYRPALPHVTAPTHRAAPPPLSLRKIKSRPLGLAACSYRTWMYRPPSPPPPRYLRTRRASAR